MAKKADTILVRRGTVRVVSADEAQDILDSEPSPIARAEQEARERGLCEFCLANWGREVSAVYRAPQGRGYPWAEEKNKSWRLVCEDHADGWYIDCEDLGLPPMEKIQ